MSLPHSEIMPLLDGDMVERLVPVKNRAAIKINFNGQVILAANEPLNVLCKDRKQSTKEALLTRLIIVEFPHRVGVGGGPSYQTRACRLMHRLAINVSPSSHTYMCV